MSKSIPDSDDTIEVKIFGGIEMGSDRVGSLEFILSGCTCNCGDPLNIVLKAKVTWGISHELDQQYDILHF